MKKNKKKILIICLSILFVVVISILVIIKTNKKEEEIVSKDRLKELIYNNYIYSYLYQGNIKTTDGFIEVDGETYYYIDDEITKEIKSFENISKLIENTFVKDRYDMYYDNVNSINKYFEVDGKIYVKKGEVCSNMPQYIDEDITYKIVTEDKIIVNYANYSLYVYKQENEWFLSGLIFRCLDDKNN